MSTCFAPHYDGETCDCPARLALVVTHTRSSTPAGPDYCAECSEAVSEWMPWPCPAMTRHQEGPPVTALTPEQFMSQPVDPDEEVDTESVEQDPLSSIASSLGAIAAHFTHQAVAQQQDDELQARYARLDEAYEQLARDFDAKQVLIDRVLEICKPSVSKLANQIRDALAEPEAPAEGPAPGASADAGASDDQTPPPALPEQPPHDADVYRWRAFARGCGYGGDDLDQLNRSQIRTVLGIPHAPGEIG